MQLVYSTMLLKFAMLLTFFVSLGLTSPAGSPLSTDAGHDTTGLNSTFVNSGAKALPPLSPRSETVADGDGNHIIIFLEDVK